MVKGIVVHIEGGQNRTTDIGFRKAFRTFFAELVDLAEERGFSWRNVLEGSRRQAYERFCNALREDPDNFHILLVDSEAPVKEFGKCWKHLKERPADQWDCPPGADDSQCHLMVIAMEAWFFADPDTLANYYGKDFQLSSLPKRQNVEQIPKADHIAKLEAATKKTQKGRYHKFNHAPDILERLVVTKVRARAPHCERIFDLVASKIRGF